MSLRKHSLEVTHGDYRRESFHCEHSLQSLLEMEGENGPAPPSPSSSSSPSPPMGGGETGGLKPLRRLGRQESPLSRDTLLTAREKESQSAASDSTRRQTESVASKADDSGSSTSSTSEVLKTNVSAAAGDGQPSLTDTKPSSGDKPLTATSAKPEATGSKSSTPGSSKGPEPESEQQSAKTETEAAAKAQEATEEKVQNTAAADKRKVQSKPHKVSEVAEKDTSGSDRATETTRTKGPAPPVPNQPKNHAADPSPAASRSKAEKATSSSRRGAKEERTRLEALEENPTSPSSKSRPTSPGDKGGFVTQLTSVAKTVLGPMKGSSQDGAKVKDACKTSEEKRSHSAGKADTWRGGQTASAGAAQHDRGTGRSSKHHS